MFTIIGGDGQEYGPATAQQIRGWLAAGRANLDTQAKAAGSDEWRRLGDFPEFAPPEELPPILGSATAGAAGDAVRVGEAADPGLRLVARLIDWVVEIVCCMPGAIMVGPLLSPLVEQMMRGQQPDFEQLDMHRFAAAGAVFALGWFAVLITQVILLSWRGQSLGKLIARVRVVRIDGAKAGFVHAWLLREALITVIGMVITILPIIGPLLLRPAFHLTDWCMIFRADRRCLHDLIAGTRVVKA